MNFLTTRRNTNSQGEVKNNEPNDFYHAEPNLWLRNKKKEMRDEDLSIYSSNMGLRCPNYGVGRDEEIHHIMRHGKKSCKFVSLILNPLLEELNELNQELETLGVPNDPSRSINEAKNMLDEIKENYPDEYRFVKELQETMRNEDLSTYSRRHGLCSNTYTGFGEEVRHIQRRGTNS